MRWIRTAVVLWLFSAYLIADVLLQPGGGDLLQGLVLGFLLPLGIVLGYAQIGHGALGLDYSQPLIRRYKRGWQMVIGVFVMATCAATLFLLCCFAIVDRISLAGVLGGTISLLSWAVFLDWALSLKAKPRSHHTQPIQSTIKII